MPFKLLAGAYEWSPSLAIVATRLLSPPGLEHASGDAVMLKDAEWVGFMTAGLVMVGLVYAFLMRLLTKIWVPRWTVLFMACSSIGGIQLVFLGVLGEYVGRIYGEGKRRPLYVIRVRLGFASMARVSRLFEKRASS